MNRFTWLASLALGALCACTGTTADSVGSDDYDLTLAAGEAEKILALVNYPGTDAEALDVDAKLDARAAANIVARRNGPDGIAPTGDDQPFVSLADLATVKFVGDSALTKLRTYALAHPAPASELVEGVAFQGWQSEAVVWGVNHASAAELKAAGLTITAANSLAAKAPYASVSAMGPVTNIGPAALGKLRTRAAAWWLAKQAPPAPVDPSVCVLDFSKSVVIAEEADFAARIEAFDPREQMYHFRRTTRVAPKCIDVTKPEHVTALTNLVIDLAGWKSMGPDVAKYIKPKPVKADAYYYRDMIHTAFDFMNEFREQKIDNGVPNVETDFANVLSAWQKLDTLAAWHPQRTVSVEVLLDMAECFEIASLMVDLETGTMLFMHRPPQC
jgi:hypothetical protein